MSEIPCPNCGEAILRRAITTPEERTLAWKMCLRSLFTCPACNWRGGRFVFRDFVGIAPLVCGNCGNDSIVRTDPKIDEHRTLTWWVGLSSYFRCRKCGWYGSRMAFSRRRFTTFFEIFLIMTILGVLAAFFVALP